MDARQKHLLASFQHLMRPHERLAARWLTEEWDGTSKKLPSWLRNRISLHYPISTWNDPEELARLIRLRLFADHRRELTLPHDA